MSESYTTNGNLNPSDVPEQVKNLADALAAIHGHVHIAREENGIHLYMASPKCLELYGESELTKRHLAVNATRALGIGAGGMSVTTGNQRKRDSCACCMKTRTPYRLTQLLAMKPLADRGVMAPTAGVTSGNVERVLVADQNGVMIPPGPGVTIPVIDLPAGHPGRIYLERRGYDLAALWHQFRTSWGEKELENPSQYGIYYRNLPLGFKATPQARIIFFADVYGVQRGWQGRVLDLVDEEGRIKYYFHPYRQCWVPCEVKNERGAWVPNAEASSGMMKWDMAKYLNAKHSSRSECLLGFDSARAAGRTLILVEGPLDAGRFGPPSIPLTGSTLTEGQANLIAGEFDRVCYIPDKGVAGDRAAMIVTKMLGPRLDLRVWNIPDGLTGPWGKVTDPGTLQQEMADEIKQLILGWK